MKKILLLSACVMLAFASCKKSDKNSPSTGANTITANVGGVDTKFNTRVTGILETSQGAYNLLVTGVTSTNANAEVMSISMLSQNPIAKGTYTINASTSPDITTIPDLAFSPDLSSTSDIDFATDPSGQNSTTTTITITSISNTNVQGTFSGVLFGTDNSTKTITNGAFNATITTH